MKPDIHPAYYPQSTIVCACGNTFTIGSTKPSLRVDICSKCHPFFTGQQKLIDTLGRVERFRERQQLAAQRRVTERPKKQDQRRQEQPMTLREMLLVEQKNKG